MATYLNKTYKYRIREIIKDLLGDKAYVMENHIKYNCEPKIKQSDKITDTKTLHRGIYLRYRRTRLGKEKIWVEQRGRKITPSILMYQNKVRILDNHEDWRMEKEKEWVKSETEYQIDLNKLREDVVKKRVIEDSLTLETAANRIGMSTAGLMYLEKGDKEPSVDTVLKVCTWLEKDPREYITVNSK